MRLAALDEAASGGPPSRRDVEPALRAHLCRCTGLADHRRGGLRRARHRRGRPLPRRPGPATPLLAAWRAQVEGPAFQVSGPDVVLGGGGFADDTAPPGALVQLGADAPLAPDLRTARRGPRPQSRAATAPCP